MKNIVSTAVLVAALALLAGCPSKPPEQPPQAEQPTTDTSGVADAGATVDDTATGGPSGELLSKRVVYFDFDRADIRGDSQGIVNAHAAYLAKNPSQKVRLEGHADERGSREYNIALGQRRADAIKRMMTLLGAQDGQIETVSFGKEKPRNPGHDEAAWAQNRRGDILYSGD